MFSIFSMLGSRQNRHSAKILTNTVDFIFYFCLSNEEIETGIRLWEMLCFLQFKLDILYKDSHKKRLRKNDGTVHQGQTQYSVSYSGQEQIPSSGQSWKIIRTRPPHWEDFSACLQSASFIKSLDEKLKPVFVSLFNSPWYVYVQMEERAFSLCCLRLYERQIGTFLNSSEFWIKYSKVKDQHAISYILFVQTFKLCLSAYLFTLEAFNLCDIIKVLIIF